MEQPHGFTFNDHTGDDPDDEEFDKAMYDQWLNREVVIDDPEQIDRIQSLVRVEERDGRRVLVVKPNALDETLDPYDIDPDDDDPTPYGYDPDDDEDGFDDDGMSASLGELIGGELWPQLDWTDGDNVLGIELAASHLLTRAFLHVIEDVGATTRDDPQPWLTQAAAAESVALAAYTARSIMQAIALGCGHNHMVEEHSKKEREAWEHKAALALDGSDWETIVKNNPDIQRFERAFHRFNDADCRMNQLVELEDREWDARIIATDGEGGFRIQLIEPDPDDDEEES